MLLMVLEVIPFSPKGVVYRVCADVFVDPLASLNRFNNLRFLDVPIELVFHCVPLKSK